MSAVSSGLSKLASSMTYQRPFYWTVKIRRSTDPDMQCTRFESAKFCEKRRQHVIKFLQRRLKGDDGPDIILDVWDDDFIPIHPSDHHAIAHLERRRHESDEHKSLRRLIRKLKSCKPKRECGSGACPVCMRQYRRWHVSELLQTVPQGGVLLLFTYSPGKRIPADKISRNHMRAIKKRLLKQLARLLPKTAQGVGWVDLKVRLTGHLEPHIHMIVYGCTEAELKAAEPRSLRKGKKLHPKKRKGKAVDPWNVQVVRAGEEQWTALYTVRSIPKRKEDYFAKPEFRDRYDPVETRHLLFKDRCEMRDRLVLFRVQKKNGKRLRSNVVKK